jgi:hypothetical protein
MPPIRRRRRPCPCLVLRLCRRTLLTQQVPIGKVQSGSRPCRRRTAGRSTDGRRVGRTGRTSVHRYAITSAAGNVDEVLDVVDASQGRRAVTGAGRVLARAALIRMNGRQG